MPISDDAVEGAANPHHLTVTTPIDHRTPPPNDQFHNLRECSDRSSRDQVSLTGQTQCSVGEPQSSVREWEGQRPENRCRIPSGYVTYGLCAVGGDNFRYRTVSPKSPGQRTFRSKTLSPTADRIRSLHCDLWCRTHGSDHRAVQGTRVRGGGSWVPDTAKARSM